jgi:Carboxypeptidase regulatory-like domain
MQIRVIAGTLLALSYLFLNVQAQQQAPAAGPGFGVIAGKVVNQKGLPVEGANVYAAPSGEQRIPPNTKLVTAVSDEKGQFLLHHVLAGTNIVMAGKEEEGYCNTLYAPFVENVARLPKVLVEKERISQGVIVVLSSCAKLSGLVSDLGTGTPIPEAQIHLMREDSQDLDLRTSPDTDGKFQFIVPKVPYTIEVSAPGYKTWKKSGITLEPETETNMNVQLEKAHS